MSELFVDYMLRFNFHSESMTTFSQSSWISGTKPIARMKNIKSKVKKEKKVKHDIHRQSFLSICCLQVQQFAIRQFLTLDPEVSQTFSYLIFVIFFTQAKFLENRIYTEKRQFLPISANLHRNLHLKTSVFANSRQFFALNL